MSCANCAQARDRAAAGRTWGGYTMHCARCCARLVISARPHRPAQEAFFALMARHVGGPTKQAVVDAIGQIDAEAAGKPEVSQGVAQSSASDSARPEVSQGSASAPVGELDFFG